MDSWILIVQGVFAGALAAIYVISVRLLIKKSDDQPIKSKGAVLLITLVMANGLSVLFLFGMGMSAACDALSTGLRFNLCFIFLCASEVCCVPIIMAGYVAR